MKGPKYIGLILALGLIGIFLQGAVLAGIIPSRFFIPNLLLTLVVFLGFYEVSVLGAVLSFLLGLELDIFSGNLVGPWAGAFTVIFGFLALFAQRVFVESGFAVMLVIFVTSLASQLVLVVFIYEFRPIGGMGFILAFGEAFVTALVSYPLFSLYRRVLLKRGDRVRSGT
jgi:rod shape-determining protein MreD